MGLAFSLCISMTFDLHRMYILFVITKNNVLENKVYREITQTRFNMKVSNSKREGPLMAPKSCTEFIAWHVVINFQMNK